MFVYSTDPIAPFQFQRVHRVTTALLWLVFSLSICAISSPCLGFEIEIRGSASGTDDYLTWAPAPARIRQAAGAVQDAVIFLTNDPQGTVLPAGIILWTEKLHLRTLSGREKQLIRRN